MEVPGILQRPEVVPEAIEAWRAWAVVELDGELRLSSLTRPERWEPGVPVTAVCRHPTHLRPRRFCTCGVYAVPRPELLAGLGSIAGGVVGQVSLWGRVVQHERGLRAQAAYPARLRLACATCLAERAGRSADVVERVEQAPGVAVIRPLCRAHASEDHPGELRAASEVEAALRSAYAVDALPADAVARIQRGRPEIEGAEAARRRRMLLSRLCALAVAAIVALPAIRAIEVPPRPLPDLTASPSANPFAGGSLLGEAGAGSAAYLGASPQHRVALRTPRGLDAPRCARVHDHGVAETVCLEGNVDVYVWDVVPAGAGREACRDGTVDATRDDDLGVISCWRSIRHQR